MNYLVVVSYDVKNGQAADHDFLYEELKRIVLEDRLTDGTRRKIRRPKQPLPAGAVLKCPKRYLDESRFGIS